MAAPWRVRYPNVKGSITDYRREYERLAQALEHRPSVTVMTPSEYQHLYLRGQRARLRQQYSVLRRALTEADPVTPGSVPYRARPEVRALYAENDNRPILANVDIRHLRAAYPVVRSTRLTAAQQRELEDYSINYMRLQQSVGPAEDIAYLVVSPNYIANLMVQKKHDEVRREATLLRTQLGIHDPSNVGLLVQATPAVPAYSDSLDVTQVTTPLANTNV